MGVVLESESGWMKGWGSGWSKWVMISRGVGDEEVEGREREEDRFVERGEEDRDEGDGGEMVDVGVGGVKVMDRYGEVIGGKGRVGIMRGGVGVLRVM